MGNVNAVVLRTVADAEYTTEQIELIKLTVCRGATDAEVTLFVQQCRRTGLDPFSRQIHAVKRWDAKEHREVMTIQVGIDGFRLVAARTGQVDGQEGPWWCGPDGSWRDVWLTDDPPAAARVFVYRKGCARPFVGVAHWREYVQTTKDGGVTRFWARMPALMLAKVAEALALRKAFPQELSGVYSPEEMAQADSHAVEEPEPRPKALSQAKEKPAPPPAEPLSDDPHEKKVTGPKPPRTGPELVAWFARADALAADEGLCRPGDLTLRTIQQIRRHSRAPDDVRDWPPATVALAVQVARETYRVWKQQEPARQDDADAGDGLAAQVEAELHRLGFAWDDALAFLGIDDESVTSDRLSKDQLRRVLEYLKGVDGEEGAEVALAAEEAAG